MDDDARRRWDMRPILAALRPILFRWDAIGCADELPEDKYDCVIFPVVRQLRNGVGAEGIADWLGAFAEDHFGVATSSEADRRAAVELVQWWNSPASPRVGEEFRRDNG